MNDAPARWCGDTRGPGILQRIGGTMMVLSFVLIIGGFQLALGAMAVYWTMVAAHALVYLGWALATVADVVAKRRFSWVRLVLTISVGFCYAVIGPVLMSAVSVSIRVEHRR